jgi:hypothetical protein
MPTVTSPPRRVQASLTEHAGLAVLVLTLLVKYRPRVDLYFVRRLPCSDVAYRLSKVDPRHDGADAEADHYDCNLTLQSCECKGFLRHGKPCKHLLGLASLHAEGGLPR